MVQNHLIKQQRVWYLVYTSSLYINTVVLCRESETHPKFFCCAINLYHFVMKLEDATFNSMFSPSCGVRVEPEYAWECRSPHKSCWQTNTVWEEWCSASSGRHQLHICKGTRQWPALITNGFPCQSKEMELNWVLYSQSEQCLK